MRLRNRLKLVQQPCSNPSKAPEMLRKRSTQKCGYLREFCKLQKAPANYLTAFTRQRSLVRNQHRPLLKSVVLQAKPRSSAKVGVPPSTLLTTVGTPTGE